MTKVIYILPLVSHYYNSQAIFEIILRFSFKNSAYLGPCYTPVMKLFAKLGNGYPTNTPRVPFPRRFNVEYPWYIFRLRLTGSYMCI